MMRRLAQRLGRSVRAFARDEAGTTVVEFAIAFVTFIVIFFALIDFGRMAFHYVVAEKAMHRAARIAVVRPPACPGVPTVNARPGTVPTPAPVFGAKCSIAGACADVGVQQCTGTATNATASEIWAAVSPILPNDATIANLRFSYAYDSQMGFLGGPYVPNVTVELTGLQFRFATGLSGLVGLMGAAPGPGLGPNIPFPPLSVSMPGEDLALGTAG